MPGLVLWCNPYMFHQPAMTASCFSASHELYLLNGIFLIQGVIYDQIRSLGGAEGSPSTQVVRAKPRAQSGFTSHENAIQFGKILQECTKDGGDEEELLSR